MALLFRSGLVVTLTVLALGCSADDTPGQQSSFDAGSTPPTTGGGMTPATSAGSDAGGTNVGSANDAGSVTVRDSGAVVDSSSVTLSDAGSDSGIGSNEAGAADAGNGDSGASDTSLTGSYGALGPVKPVVSSYWISTGLETILYLSSTPLECATIMTEGGRWLLMLPSDSQVLEIVMRGTAKVGTLKIPPAEANYAQGSKSSATEKVASSGTLMITKAEAKGVIEGSVMATYSAGSVMGEFRAEFCQGGQEW